jgi:hypothetical protein
MRQKEREEAERIKAAGGRAAGGRQVKQTSQPSDDEDDDSLLDLQIPPDLLEIIEDPDEETEYPVPFDSPDELMKIFTELEDQNLFLIGQSQENEEQIEILKKDHEEIEIEMERELGKLAKAKDDVNSKISVAA